MNPNFESTVQRELGPEHLVFTESQEHPADCDSEYRKSRVIPVSELSEPFHQVTTL